MIRVIALEIDTRPNSNTIKVPKSKLIEVASEHVEFDDFVDQVRKITNNYRTIEGRIISYHPVRTIINLKDDLEITVSEESRMYEFWQFLR